MQIEETQVLLRKLVSDDGKVFARKEDGEVLGSVLWLGVDDNPDNYIEIDTPEIENDTEI